jgi:hypothetical protein
MFKKQWINFIGGPVDGGGYWVYTFIHTISMNNLPDSLEIVAKYRRTSATEFTYIPIIAHQSVSSN